MPQSALTQDAADQLSQTFRAAWQHIVEEQQRILTDPNQLRRRACLRALRSEVEAQMNLVDSRAQHWVRNQLQTVYAAGGVAGEVEHTFGWTQIHLDALHVLQRDTMSNVLSATRYVRRDVKRFIREMSKERLVAKLIEGKTATQAGREIAALLRERGIKAVVYSNGAHVGLDAYGDMLARTKTAEAYNIGTLKQSAQDTKFWEILDGPECGLAFHDDGDQADGKIVTEDICFKYVISHPNCRRSFAPRPDLVRRIDAEQSTTAAQRQDIRQADRARQALRSRVARRRRRRRT